MFSKIMVYQKNQNCRGPIILFFTDIFYGTSRQGRMRSQETVWYDTLFICICLVISEIRSELFWIKVISTFLFSKNPKSMTMFLTNLRLNFQIEFILKFLPENNSNSNQLSILCFYISGYVLLTKIYEWLLFSHGVCITPPLVGKSSPKI